MPETPAAVETRPGTGFAPDWQQTTSVHNLYAEKRFGSRPRPAPEPLKRIDSNLAAHKNLSPGICARRLKWAKHRQALARHEQRKKNGAGKRCDVDNISFVLFCDEKICPGTPPHTPLKKCCPQAYMSTRLSLVFVAHIKSERGMWFLFRQEVSAGATNLRPFGLFPEQLIGARFGAHLAVPRQHFDGVSVFCKGILFAMHMRI